MSDSSSDKDLIEESKTRSSDDTDIQFRLPSFVPQAHTRTEPADEANESIIDEQDGDDDEDDYTLDSTPEEPQNPILLVQSHQTHQSAKSSESKIASRLKRTFTFSSARRRSTTFENRVPKRSSTSASFMSSHDVEKNAAANEQINDHEIAEGLVKAHSSVSDRRANSKRDALYNDQSYLIKEEYDDELNDVNDKYSEIPRNVQTGILSSLLQLYNDDPRTKESDSSSEELNDDFEDLMPSKSAGELDQLRSRFSRKFKSHNRSKSPLGLSSPKLARLNKSSNSMELPKFHKKKKSTKSKLQQLTHHKKMARARITVHIADILQRQKFILKLCKTFMLYGAPTHRLEEYLIATSRVLEIDASFIYFPGCMLISFGDATTRTSEMHLVRLLQGVDLSKLHKVHDTYKKVMHDEVSVDIAIEELDDILNSRPIYNNYVLIFVNGLSSLFITSWGFKGGWRDMPISFVLGAIVGFLQIVISPKSNTYSSVFEVSTSIVVAFVSRAFGSIGSQKVFCFSAITLSSLVAILPGYTILCGSLELQSRNMVSGAVRMFYAIIYSLFLGFGIILGSALYKWVDSGATTETTCPSDIQISKYYTILFVPLFALTQAILGQAHLSQLPVMLIISCVSYVGYYFASLHFASSAEFSAAIGAFLVGIQGNLYSRFCQGLAVSAMYPGILLLVPGSIGLKSSLTSGVAIADDIVNGEASSSFSTSDSSLSFGIAMVEVAIGLCVGLIGAALVVYPLGKKRTGLFTL